MAIKIELERLNQIIAERDEAIAKLQNPLKATDLPWYDNEKTVLCLRTVNQEGKAYEGFPWPTSGMVTAPDWKPTVECGNGLHGYLRGCGDADSIQWGGIFQVVKVIESEVIDLKGKVKFPKCEVIYSGNRKEATDILIREYPGLPVIGGFAVDMKDNGTATAGYYGTATAGYKGTAMAGKGGIATAGNCGTVTVGDYGTAMAGYRGTAMAGYRGIATAGYKGTATAGDWGTATVGYYGIATAGNNGIATAGEKGRLSILYHDYKTERYREVIGYVGEDGIEANVAYRLDFYTHKFVKA